MDAFESTRLTAEARRLPVTDPGQLAVDLIRLAAEVLEQSGMLEVLDTSWVVRHVRSANSVGNGCTTGCHSEGG